MYKRSIKCINNVETQSIFVCDWTVGGDVSWFFSVIHSWALFHRSLPEMHKQQFETVWKLHDRGVYFEVRMRNTSSEVISIYIIDKKTQKIVLIPQ